MNARVEAALERLAPDWDALKVSHALRREFPADIARRAAELWELRGRAKARFPSGQLRALTRKGLEQATREAVARERARRIVRAVPGALVFDATCGLGGDATALVDAGARVLAADLDEATARCASTNLEGLGCRGRVLQADAAFPPLAAPSEAFWLVDPDRRAAGQRSLDPRDWSPTLRRVLALLPRFRGACVKLPPSFDVTRLEGELPSELRRAWQWTSFERELCEVALWTGAALEGESGEREAVALSAAGPSARLAGPPATVAALEPEALGALRWLADPDPAVVRAGLLGNLAAELGLQPLDPHIAYLGGEHRPVSPFVRAWPVLGVAPADRRKVSLLLGRLDIGAVDVMKRGHSETGEVLARRFRGRGARRGLIAFARLDSGHVAIVLDPRGESAQPRVGDEGFEPPTSSL